MKKMRYHKKIVNSYFWRTIQQQEIDYVEESNGEISAYEFKWKNDGRVRIPESFAKSYQTKGKVISGTTLEVFSKKNKFFAPEGTKDKVA